MRLYGYDKEFIVLRNKEGVILYSSYSNKVLKLNLKAYELFEVILKNAEQFHGDIDHVYRFYQSKDVVEFVHVLAENSMLFLNRKDMDNADYYIEYMKDKMINPHKAYLHLTTNCNLNCSYCYNKRNIGTIVDMTTDQWFRVLDILSNNYFNYVVFTGGEVMLRDDITELVRYSKKKNFHLHILSNGTIEIPEEIIQYADAVEISLDSFQPQMNAGVRKGSEKYEIVKKLETIPDALKNKIIIKMVVSDYNFDDLLKSRTELHNRGFHYIELTPQQPNKKEEKYLYDRKTVPRERHEFDAKQIALCNGCYEVIAINADGNIYPCQALIHPDFYLSNIFEENWLSSVKKSRITKIFFEDDLKNSECRDCAYKFLCGGPCKAVAFHVTGDFMDGRDYYCDFAKRECNAYLESIEFSE